MKKLFARDSKAEPKQKTVDTVIDAVRYDPAGQVEKARVYERRGPTWSDWMLISRAELVERLKNGQRVAVGRRQIYMAGTFEVTAEVRLAGEVLVSGSAQGGNDGRDDLPDAPLF